MTKPADARRKKTKRTSMQPKRAKQLARIGWREWVTFPEFTAVPLKAKIDTGALTSSLHAFSLEELDGGNRVRFEIHPHQRSRADSTTVECDVVDHRPVRSSSGHVQTRPVIITDITLDGATFPIELTLTNRDEMGFRLLVGRRALRRRFVVDAGRSYLGNIAP